MPMMETLDDPRPGGAGIWFDLCRSADIDCLSTRTTRARIAITSHPDAGQNQGTEKSRRCLSSKAM